MINVFTMRLILLHEMNEGWAAPGDDNWSGWLLGSQAMKVDKQCIVSVSLSSEERWESQITYSAPRNENPKPLSPSTSSHTNFPLTLPKMHLSQISLTIAYLSKSPIMCPRPPLYKPPPSAQFHSLTHSLQTSFSGLHSLLFSFCGVGRRFSFLFLGHKVIQFTSIVVFNIGSVPMGAEFCFWAIMNAGRCLVFSCYDIFKTINACQFLGHCSTLFNLHKHWRFHFLG